MMFKQKKDKKYLKELGLDEDEIIEFNDFKDFDESDIDETSTGPNEFEKHFVFHISEGCPICGGDVKGNSHFKYFCSHCNVLFDKKDILDGEFGNKVKRGIRKTRLSDDERRDLETKRKELTDRVFKTFSEDVKEKLIEEEKVEQSDDEPADKEETAEDQEPEGIEKSIEDVPVDTEETNEESRDQEETEDKEETKEELMHDAPEKLQKRKEYNLESPDKIIASNESTKMHKGDCHFVKKIHPENRIYLDSIEEGKEKGYSLCVCLRRLKAMQR